MNRRQILIAASLTILGGTGLKIKQAHDKIIRDRFYWLNNPRFANRTIQGLMTVTYDENGRQRAFTYKPLA